MKVLTVTNRKGGVGKTTQSRTLCEYFSVVRHLRVLAIDLDSQCSLSHLFLEMDMSQVGEQGAVMDNEHMRGGEHRPVPHRA